MQPRVIIAVGGPLRGRNHVGVIGQHDHVARVGRFGGGADHFDAGVVGGAAAEQGGCAELAKGAHKAGALHDGEHCGILFAFVHSGRLRAHVHGPEGANLALGFELRVGQLGFVGVQVDAEAIAVGREHHGFLALALQRSGGDFGERLAQRVAALRARDDQFGAKALQPAALVESAREPGVVDVAEVGRGVWQRVAAQGGAHAAHGQLESARARIDDAGAGQCRIELGRLLDVARDGLKRRVEQRRRGVGRIGCGCFGCRAGGADHRSLAGFGERRIGGIRAGCERAAQRGGVDSLALRRGRAQPAQPLGGDHAGAAARAEQGGVGGDARGLVKRRVVVQRIEGGGGGGQRAAQICAGVAVGHGVDVDSIERVAVQGDPAGGAGQHPPPGAGVDLSRLIGHGEPPAGAQLWRICQPAGRADCAAPSDWYGTCSETHRPQSPGGRVGWRGPQRCPGSATCAASTQRSDATSDTSTRGAGSARRRAPRARSSPTSSDGGSSLTASGCGRMSAPRVCARC